MEETNDVIPINEEKILASLGYVVMLLQTLLLQIMKISKCLKIS
jgi:hypothetical protein